MPTEPQPSSAQQKSRAVIKIVLRHPTHKLDDAVAQTLTRPEIQAAATIQGLDGHNYEVNALINELTAQVEAVNGGDLKRPEGLLIAQAHTLDALFHTLTRRAHLNIERGYLDAGERYMRLALKAQTQCRATVETLAAMKNPPMLFARQANIAAGPQQINNGLAPSDPRARESRIEHSKLSGGSNELLPDSGTSPTTSRVDSPLETMGKIDRTENAGRKGARQPKRLQG
jgi:hypothetical protein